MDSGKLYTEKLEFRDISIYRLIVNRNNLAPFTLTFFILFLVTPFSFSSNVKVTRVIDGDTIEIESGEKVRLIGINSPEISDIFGIEAKGHLSQLIENKYVKLQKDNISSDRDRYQRLLRYVYIDEVDINKRMISDGYAFAYLSFRFSKSSEYEQAQIEAKNTKQGIWGGNEEKVLMSGQEEKSLNFWSKIPTKAYVVGSLVLALMIVGLIAHFRVN